MATDWRDSREYRVWRATVIRRDGRCALPWCSSIKGREAHHMDHAAFFPDRRFLPENGITVCKRCHSHYHNDYHGSTKLKCTKADWVNFAQLVRYLMSLAKGGGTP